MEKKGCLLRLIACVETCVPFGIIDFDIVLTVVVVPSTTVLLPVLGAFIRITGRAGDPLSPVPERRFFTAAATASDDAGR